MTSFLRSLADFIEPTGLVWLLLSACVVIALKQRKWKALILPATAWLLLTLTAATALPHALVASLEARWQPVEISTLPECDAIIVLGGGMEPSISEPAGIHMKGAADRLFTGLMLAKKGRGRLLVLGGGMCKMRSGTESEADAAMRWVEEWQLSPVPVLSLGNCTDTHDEAVKVSALAAKHSWKKVALVTSAYHMTRAKAVFENAGTAVVAVPCNYVSLALREQRAKWFDVPNAGNLAHFEAWMHEMIGWWAYRFCGWI